MKFKALFLTGLLTGGTLPLGMAQDEGMVYKINDDLGEVLAEMLPQVWSDPINLPIASRVVDPPGVGGAIDLTTMKYNSAFISAGITSGGLLITCSTLVEESRVIIEIFQGCEAEFVDVKPLDVEGFTVGSFLELLSEPAESDGE